MIELESRNDLDPICPFCEAKVKKVFMKEIQSSLGRRYVYFCSECLKILGVTHRKGFFMG